MLVKPFPVTVYYDPDAASELANDVKSKEDRKAIYNVSTSCVGWARNWRLHT